MLYSYIYIYDIADILRCCNSASISDQNRCFVGSVLSKVVFTVKAVLEHTTRSTDFTAQSYRGADKNNLANFCLPLSLLVAAGQCV